MSVIDRLGLSPAQAAVVLDERPRVLVAAGAGSGKTRVLVACVLHALVDQELPVERLIAVTFTRKAGAELASRISTSLEECGRADLAISLDAAATGTIHSLCRRLVKDRALEAGVDPGCAVLEAEAATLLKEEVSREVWETVVERADEQELSVLAQMGESLREEVVSLYDRLRTMGQEEPHIDIAASLDEKQARSRLMAAIEAAREAAQKVAKPSLTLQSDLSKIMECRAWLEAACADGGLDEALATSAGFFPSRKTPSMEPFFADVRAALTRYRCWLAERSLETLVRVTDRLLARFHQAYTARKQERGLLDFADLELRARALLRAGQTGGARQAAFPGAFLLVDEFQDTNELQCEILELLGAGRTLMVGDERQSIYRFRGADVDVFRRRKTELACPDPTGSAGPVHPLDMNYRSSPEILAFINRVFAQADFFGEGFACLLPDPAWAPAAAGDGAGCASAPDMAAGTDSPALRPAPGPIPAAAGAATTSATGLASVGTPVSGVTAPAAGVATATAPTAPTVAGVATAPAAPTITVAAPVEVLVAERPEQAEEGARPVPWQQAEAVVVADRVRAFIDREGRHQRDIVLLLPAQTQVDLYEQAMRAKGVGVYVVRGKGYYSQEEVGDVAALLRLLVNPHNDLTLVSVLRSPFVGISDDALYLLGRERRVSQSGSLWDVIRSGSTDALGHDDRRLLAEFLGSYREIRLRVGRPGLSRLIDDAISAFSYDICLLAAPDGRRRFANVRKLMRLAGEFEALNGPDLAGFVDLLGSMGDLGDAEGSAPTLAESEDVVRVMTVHQAKGLEFPVVVVAGLGTDVPAGRPSMFMVGSGGRAGVFLKGSRNKTYEDHDLCWGPAVEIAVEETAKRQEEDVRLLYVAMTRAEERLVLVGVKPKSGEMQKTRIGRLLTALGLGEFPDSGSVVPIEGLDAIVVGAAPPPVEQEGDEISWGSLQGGLSVEAAATAVAGAGAVGVAAAPAGASAEAAAAAIGAEASLVDLVPQFIEATPWAAAARRVSFSGLAAYQRCPRKFYLERVLGLSLSSEAAPPGAAADTVVLAGTACPGAACSGTTAPAGDLSDDDPRVEEDLLDDEEQSSGRDVGLLVHALLERLPDESTPPTPEAVRQAAAGTLLEMGITLVPADVERAVRLTLAFWESPVAGMRSTPSTLREAPFFFAQGDTVVSGVMDLIYQGEECWRIVDYKTNRLGGRTPQEAAVAYRMQSVVYRLAALKAGAPAAQMDFVFLESPAEPVSMRSEQADATLLEAELSDALDGLRRGRFPACRGEMCSHCEVAEMCAGMTRP